MGFLQCLLTFNIDDLIINVKVRDVQSTVCTKKDSFIVATHEPTKDGTEANQLSQC